MSKALMIQGTASGVGKTIITAGLCRIFADRGYDVAPFKSQNMSNYAYVIPGGLQVSRAQAVQAIGARCTLTTDMNPILLKPLGDYYVELYVGGRLYHERIHAKQYYEEFVLTDGLKHAGVALSVLQEKFDLVILEGAGSPAEINLQKYDIANMRMAERAGAAVLLVADIDRGGSFASLVGTMNLIEEQYRQMVRGFILNKFRGDDKILQPAFERVRAITGIPILGTIHMLDNMCIPEEDSLGATKPSEIAWTKQDTDMIDTQLDRVAGIILESVGFKEIENMIR